MQPLILWAACADAAQCPPIAPGATRLDDPGLIDGMPETEAVVNWWHAVRGADGVMRPDSIRSIIVTLQRGAARRLTAGRRPAILIIS